MLNPPVPFVGNHKVGGGNVIIIPLQANWQEEVGNLDDVRGVLV